MTQINGFLASINGGVNTVVCLNSQAGDCLLSNQFQSCGSDTYSIHCAHRDDQVRVFEFLRKNKFAFSAGRDWSPAEIFEFFREQGLVAGEYLRISWIGPDEPTVAVC
ncbi:hypothetical protein NQT62_00905 [Limnobacter humi]|uniref:Uncharacterized protein n=1 Tax=Limnobacter humi TaxID=1778671 RepID=A0ABT1WBV7_9BURK|nr:hypothetical protein [Limnobacter humi]MCQ8894994.1 hypothetical protein [Limnobacter humi]